MVNPILKAKLVKELKKAQRERGARDPEPDLPPLPTTPPQPGGQSPTGTTAYPPTTTTTYPPTTTTTYPPTTTTTYPPTGTTAYPPTGTTTTSVTSSPAPPPTPTAAKTAWSSATPKPGTSADPGITTSRTKASPEHVLKLPDEPPSDLSDLFDDLYYALMSSMESSYSGVASGGFAAWVKKQREGGEAKQRASFIPTSGNPPTNFAAARTDQNWRTACDTWATEVQQFDNIAFLDAVDKFRLKASRDKAQAILDMYLTTEKVNAYPELLDPILERMENRESRDLPAPLWRAFRFQAS